jgi:hypothetical protein
MDEKDFYARWIEHRRQVPVPDHFAAGVMAAIENPGSREEYELPPGLIVFSNRLMRRAAAAGLLLLGLLRMLYIAGNLLRANPLMPF